MVLPSSCQGWLQFVPPLLWKLWVLLLVPLHFSIPRKHCLPHTSVMLKLCYFIHMCPFSWGQKHWYVITKKPIYSSCPQMPSRTSFMPGTILFLPMVDTARLFLCLCWSHGRWTPLLPISWSRWSLLLLRAALPAIYVQPTHSSEMELWPKVRSSLDATWILIWGTYSTSRPCILKLFFLKYPMASLHLTSCIIMQMKVTSFTAMQ